MFFRWKKAHFRLFMGGVLYFRSFNVMKINKIILDFMGESGYN